MNQPDNVPIRPVHLRTGSALLIVVLSGHLLADDARGKETHDAPILVRNPKMLSVDKIPCRRIPLGELGDYKPSLACLPSGELLLSMFTGRQLQNGKIAEQAVLYRSFDGGQTWSERAEPDIAGREPSLSVARDGTIFITAHLLAQDQRNQDGYTHSYLHRSQDGGRTWNTTRVEPKEFRPRTAGLTTRNVLQLADGSLLLAISEHAPSCQSYVLRSTDNGTTWTEKYRARFEDVPENYPYTIFGEAHLWQARSGKLYAILRVGAGNSWPLPGTTDRGKNDQSERMIVYASTDRGRNWSKVRDLGDYGQMYMSILHLGDRRLLLTFTQRAVTPPLGVRAVLGRETNDGFEFDVEHDQIMLDTKTPVGQASGGGFGPTVRLKDGTLVTSYTYRGADNHRRAEVVRWRMPEVK